MFDYVDVDVNFFVKVEVVYFVALVSFPQDYEMGGRFDINIDIKVVVDVDVVLLSLVSLRLSPRL